MENPLISVIIPIFKVEKYLNRCIESVINQTYKNLEIILVDDGSPDNCPKMCDVWALKDSRIMVIHKRNAGLAEARNTGMMHMTGDYVLFVDSDDWIEPDMVEFLYFLSVKYDADVTRCGFFTNYENTGVEKDECFDLIEKTPEYNELIVDLLSGSYLSGVAWNKLFKSSAIKDCWFSVDDGCSEDIMFIYRVYKTHIQNVVFCDASKYHYNIRNDSITNNSSFGRGAFDIIRAKSAIMQDLKQDEYLYPYAIKSFIMSAYIVLSGCIQHNAFEKEKKELIKNILVYKPVIFKSNNYSLYVKAKTLILSLSPYIFEKMIKRKHKNND